MYTGYEFELNNSFVTIITAHILERGITLSHHFLEISLHKRTSLFLMLFMKWDSKRKMWWNRGGFSFQYFSKIYSSFSVVNFSLQNKRQIKNQVCVFRLIPQLYLFFFWECGPMIKILYLFFKYLYILICVIKRCC